MTTTLHFHRPADAKPAPSLLARLLAWLRPKPAFKQAPPIRNAHLLGIHVAGATNSRSALR